MQKYLTLSGEIVQCEIVSRRENTVTVSDKSGNRYLCRIKDQGIHIPSESSGPKGWQSLNLTASDMDKQENRPSKIRAIEPNGKIVDFVNAKSAANHYASAYSTIARNCQSDAPVKSGALKGYKFERIS